jgi:hypothetical protein
VWTSENRSSERLGELPALTCCIENVRKGVRGDARSMDSTAIPTIQRVERSLSAPRGPPSERLRGFSDSFSRHFGAAGFTEGDPHHMMHVCNLDGASSDQLKSRRHAGRSVSMQPASEQGPAEATTLQVYSLPVKPYEPPTAVVSAVGPPLLRLRSEGREGYRNTRQDGARQAIRPRSNTTA